MATLTTKQRQDMPLSRFALPGRRFPITDDVHARMALSGATRAEHAGNISAGQADTVRHEARAFLQRKPVRR
jgi:hypothetical protein